MAKCGTAAHCCVSLSLAIPNACKLISFNYHTLLVEKCHDLSFQDTLGNDPSRLVSQGAYQQWFESKLVVSHCAATGCLLLVPAKNTHKIKHLLVCYRGK